MKLSQLRHTYLLIILLSMAFAIRLVPLTLSSLPYNIDGFPLVKISENIIQNQGHDFNHHVSLIDYNSKMPVFSLLLSTFSLFTGISPMRLVQLFVPLVTITTLITVYFITYKMTDNKGAAFFAGFVLAFNGLYVYLSSAAMKQAIGMTLVPIIIYLYHGRACPKKRALAMGMLLLMPLVHHLSTIIVFVMVTVMMLTENLMAKATLRTHAYDFLTGPFLFTSGFMYYRYVQLYQVTKVSNFNDIVLLISVLIIGVTCSIILARDKRRRIVKFKWFNGGLLAMATCLFWLVLNSQTKTFGVRSTPPSLLVMMIPYVVMAMVAILGFGLVRYTRTKSKSLIISLSISPFIMMMFAILNGLDPFTADLVVRSYDFVDFGMAICGGIGIMHLYNKLKPLNLKIARAALPAFAVCCILTLPLAFNVTEVFGIRTVTPEHDFAACEYAASLDKMISTDQRLSDIITPYFYAESAMSTPLLMDRQHSIQGKLILADEEWTTRGAHMFPLDNVVINQGYFDAMLNSNNVIYSGGLEGDMMYIVVT
jgi:hypothetical protein